MATVAVAFDGTRLDAAEALGTVWTDIGGGKAAQEPDFVYQGSFSVSEKVGTTEGGVALDTVATTDFTTPRVWIAKVIATNFGALNNKGATGGILEIGSGGRRSAYDRYYVVGGDTYPIRGGWLIIPIDPNGGNQSARPGTAPTLTAIDYFGWACDFGATSKAENVAMDAVDYITSGTGLTLTGGDGADPDGTFADFVSTDEGTSTNRWGVISTLEGIIYVTGVLTIGSATATVFTDSGAVVVFPDAEFLNSTGFFGLNLGLQSGTTVISIEGCTFVGRGTTAGTVDTRPEMNVTGTSGTGTLTGCVLENFGAIVLTSGVELDVCDITTDDLTQASASIHDGVIRTTSLTQVAVLDDPTFGTTTGLRDTEFIQEGAGHAIEITTPGSYDFTGISFTDYGGTPGSNLVASSGANDAAVYNSSGGAVTINVVGGGTQPSVRNAASSTTTVNQNTQVTLTGLVNNTEVRVYLQGTGTEIAGQENVTTGSFAFTTSATTAVDIRVFATSYLPADILNYIVPASDASIPVQQVFDRNYSNP